MTTAIDIKVSYPKHIHTLGPPSPLGPTGPGRPGAPVGPGAPGDPLKPVNPGKPEDPFREAHHNCLLYDLLGTNNIENPDLKVCVLASKIQENVQRK